MAKGKHVNKDWSTDRKGAFEFIFNTHFWGDRNNAGKNYKRRSKSAPKE